VLDGLRSQDHPETNRVPSGEKEDILLDDGSLSERCSAAAGGGGSGRFEDISPRWGVLESEAFKKQMLGLIQGNLGENHASQLLLETAEQKASRVVARNWPVWAGLKTTCPCPASVLGFTFDFDPQYPVNLSLPAVRPADTKLSTAKAFRSATCRTHSSLVTARRQLIL